MTRVVQPSLQIRTRFVRGDTCGGREGQLNDMAEAFGTGVPRTRESRSLSHDFTVPSQVDEQFVADGVNHIVSASSPHR
jgi:hypothetical protein